MLKKFDLKVTIRSLFLLLAVFAFSPSHAQDQKTPKDPKAQKDKVEPSHPTTEKPAASSATPNPSQAAATTLRPEEATRQGLAAIEANDFKKALEIFDLSLKAGHPEAGFYLGRMVELGLGVPANPGAAAVLYKVAAEKGNAKAINRVGLMRYRGEAGVLQDFAAARTDFCRAADLGEADAMFNCAEIINEGKGGEKNIANALKYYQKAVEKGHIGALNVLGLFYRDGKEVGVDKTKARAYFLRSANKGNPVGLFELARFYEEDKDLVNAHVYYNLASARNHPRAPEMVQRISATMSGTDVNKAQELAKNWKAQP